MADKQAKAQKNVKNEWKSQALDLMRWATANKRMEKIKAFKNIFSDLMDKKESINNMIPMLSTILPSEKSK